MLIPKLYDNFPTDPSSDPLYKFFGTYAYNGTFDRMEFTLNYSGMEILNSAHSTGVFEADIHFQPTGNSGTDKTYIRAFGYNWVIGYSFMFVTDDQNTDWINFATTGNWFSGDNQFGLKRPSLVSKPSSIRTTRVIVRIVSTNYGVELYIDDILKFIVPTKHSSHNIRIVNGGTENTSSFYVYYLSVNTDSALPTAPTILSPAEAGTINAAQEVTLQIPSSRLFVDLGSYAPSITGLTNVVYDPGGANVSMAEDTGIPDRAGNTTGDYYLEIPSNGAAHDYRLVIKEAFVTANSVVVTDSVDFDVSPSPATQTGTVDEDDDLQSYLNVFSNLSSSKGEVSLAVLGKVPVLHNNNADGNANNYNSGGLYGAFDYSPDSIPSLNSSVSFPVQIDIDLGRVYRIKRINAAQSSVNSPIFTGFDLYSKTTPFSGAGIQGTLEFTNYPIPATAAGNVFDTPADFFQNPTLAFDARYLRFEVPTSAYLNAAIGSFNLFPYDFDIIVQDNMVLNSVDDNAQFEYDSGSGYVAFPAGGVPQGSGFVRITLPPALQVASGDRVFASVQFQADLTD